MQLKWLAKRILYLMGVVTAGANGNMSVPFFPKLTMTALHIITKYANMTLVAGFRHIGPGHGRIPAGFGLDVVNSMTVRADS